MKELLSIVAALIAGLAYIPYARDILKGRVKPARSARLMFTILLTITILQQNELGSGWLVAITVGDWLGSLAILLLAIKRGVGGFSTIDKLCYFLLIIDVSFWQLTGNTLVALHLSILADLIAFTPTMLKTWLQPWTETGLFFFLGSLAPFINIIGVGKYSYSVLVFPVYLGLINLFEFFLVVFRKSQVKQPRDYIEKDYQPVN